MMYLANSRRDAISTSETAADDDADSSGEHPSAKSPPLSGKMKDKTRNELIKHFNKETTRMNKQHKDDIAKLRREHAMAMQELKIQHEAAMKLKKEEIRELQRKAGVIEPTDDTQYDALRNKIAELLARMDAILVKSAAALRSSDEKFDEMDRLPSSLSRRMSLQSAVLAKLLTALSVLDARMLDYQEQLSSLQTLLCQEQEALCSVCEEYRASRTANELAMGNLKTSKAALEILLVETETSLALANEEIEELKEKSASEAAAHDSIVEDKNIAVRRSMEQEAELSELKKDLRIISSALNSHNFDHALEDMIQKNLEHEMLLALLKSAVEDAEAKNTSIQGVIGRQQVEKSECEAELAKLEQNLQHRNNSKLDPESTRAEFSRKPLLTLLLFLEIAVRIRARPLERIVLCFR